MAPDPKLSVNTDVPGDKPRRSPRLGAKSPGALEPPSAEPAKSNSRSNSKAATPVKPRVSVTDATPIDQNDLGDEGSPRGTRSGRPSSDNAARDVSHDSEASANDAESSKKVEKGHKGKASASNERPLKERKHPSAATARKHTSASSKVAADSDQQDDDEDERGSESSGESDSAAGPDHAASSFDDDDDGSDTSDGEVTGRDLLTDTGKPYENTTITIGRGPARLKQMRAVDIDADAMDNVTVDYPNVNWYDEVNDEEIIFEIMNVRERTGSSAKRPPRTVIYDSTPSESAAGRYEGSLPAVREAYAGSSAFLPVLEELDAFNEENKSIENGWWLSFDEFKTFYGDIHFKSNESPVSCLWVTFHQNGTVEYAGFRVKIPVYDGKKATGSYDEYRIEGPAGWIKRLIPKKIFDLAVERYKSKVMRAPREWRDAVKPIREILRSGGWSRAHKKRTTLEIIEHEFKKKKGKEENDGKQVKMGKKDHLLRDVRESTFASPPPADVGRRRRGETPGERRVASNTAAAAGKGHRKAQTIRSKVNDTVPKSPVSRGQRVTAVPARGSGSKSTGAGRVIPSPRQGGLRKSITTASPSDRSKPSRRR